MAKPILEVDNFKLAFYGPRGRVPAIHGIDLSIFTGEKVALVGESGSGKTALCRAILGLHSRHAQTEQGSIRLCGQKVSSMSEEQLETVRGKAAAMVFQDPKVSLNPVFSVGEQIAEAVRLHAKVSKAKAKTRAVELLRQVGIPEPEIRYHQYPHQFSGGMGQRVCIAIALACDPALFIADEPTTSLDPEAQGEIMELLQRVCTGEDKALLFVTHDLGLAEQLADRIAVMKDGLIVEEGPAAEIFARPQHDYTKKLLHYAAYGKGISHYHGHGGMGVYEGGPREVYQGAAVDHHDDGFRTAQCDGRPLVSVQNVTKRFPISKKEFRTVLDDVSLNIYRGEVVGLIGPSGQGKSTLARCIMGIEPVSSGRIAFAEGVHKQMIFQDSAAAMNPRMTIEEIIAEPLRLRARARREDLPRARAAEAVRRAMESVELPADLAARHPYELSGGQRQRAAIARALITKPDFIIADEPVSSLDVSIQGQIIHLLKKLQEERQLTMLLISHDLPMVEHVSDRIITLK